ncbi:hypothetical protein [Paenibacillus ginsengarvi]|uniref:Uncharacterized protein n=1 Tax=Paenibacillus ginsengarvi TaxID=400777 RepID=A0A3B0BFD1_9BACL|nr:hypothetical protein [Paenibacillus ginsengarvi]RKN71885.1 hypothetical protein D7M11_29090 [Paenibacillus ginsengarvi]
MRELAFLRNRALETFLDESWDEQTGMYRQSDGQPAVCSFASMAMVHHMYLYLWTKEETHRYRFNRLLERIVGLVTENGLVYETVECKAVNDHPGFAFTICRSLGLAYGHLKEAGMEHLEQPVRDAVVRIARYHPEAGEKGTAGADQSLRFEILSYYFAYLVTDEPYYLNQYKTLFDNGIYAYTHSTVNGKYRHLSVRPGIQEAVLHPDFTFNYGCGTGAVNELPVNTHTPAYYLTELDGFMFTYAHGLKNGLLERTAHWDDFCVKYAEGLYKDLSRAGRMSCDVDGYGLYRAWYGKVIFESAPLACLADPGPLAERKEMQSHFKWFADRFLDHFASSDHFRETGVPPHQPYGHRLTVEKQFDKFNCIEIYAKVATYAYEFGIPAIEAAEPEPYYAYSWWHRWVRVSTPVYETSFAACTSGCNTPTAPHFGGEFIGTIVGGAAITTLFAGDGLVYAPPNDPDYLFGMEVQDRNGKVARSGATLFGESFDFSVTAPDGRTLDPSEFVPYGHPHVKKLGAGIEPRFRKQSELPCVTFDVHNRFEEASIRITQCFSAPPGLFVRKGWFNIPVPKLSPLRIRLKDGRENVYNFDASTYIDIRSVRAFIFEAGGKCCQIEIEKAENYSNEDNTELCVGSRGRAGEPGGINSFCPYPLGLIRIGSGARQPHKAELIVTITFI